MKRLLLASALSMLAASAIAQTTNGFVGQTNGGTINPAYYNNNSDSAGFSEMAISLLVVPSTSTAQATFSTNGGALTGTVITTKTTVITTCSSTTGPTLPAVQRYTPVTIINRSGGSCLVFPSLGTTVETALGTDGSANASFTQLTNTDVTYRPVPTAAGGVKWVQ